MPGSILNADTMFPNLREGTADEKIEKIGSYLYMLLEQLRYSMGNLDAKNFNESGLDELAGLITEPVYLRLEDEEGRLTQLSATAEGLTSRVTNAEGSITTLTQTAGSLSSRVTNAEGNISSLTQTAASLESRITTLDGEVDTRISQTLNGITLEVTNGEQSSTLRLLSNGVQLSSDEIQFTGDVVFASELQNGTTVVSGDCIRTGILDTQYVKLRNLLEVVDGLDQTAGYVGYGYSSLDSSSSMMISDSTMSYGVLCSSSGAKIAGLGGEVVVAASKVTVTPVHPLSPAGGWGYEFYSDRFTAVRGEDLGSAGAPWGTVYCGDVYINGQSVKAALGI